MNPSSTMPPLVRLATTGIIMGACYIGACTFTAELDPLDNGQCGTGQKSCNERCVGLADPRTGCSLDTCAPCSLANATARCAPNGTCTISACRPGFENCDENGLTGCETDIDFDPNHCGSCRGKCDLPNALAGCTNGACVVGSCLPHWGDCDGKPENGCETPIDTNSLHCGQCGKTCAPSHQCVMSHCTSGEGG
ncbi:hypothetical protein LZC95_05255 [Pendulispora brunnea]|uniref:Tryptophan synthase alpha chain n=1 Tax=Pendulispora brunnea TaxID=2905690 RepID=A0ABZ2KC38_9BACT